MKKTCLILGAIGLLTTLLVARLVLTHKNSMTEEREWFAKSLRYEFSAQIDTIWKFNEHAGRIRCILTAGNPLIHREDSLKKLFKKHDMLYLIYIRSNDTITFILPNNANLVSRGDSLRVSSRENKIEFFRDGVPLATDSLTATLTGFSRPFFFKKKK